MTQGISFQEFLKTPLGSPTNTVGKFVLDFLKAVPFSLVSKAFYAFNQQVMLQEGRAFFYVHPEDILIHNVKISSLLPPESHIQDALSDRLAHFSSQFNMEQYPRITALLKDFEREKELALQETNPDRRDQYLKSLFIDLCKIESSYAEWQKNKTETASDRLFNRLLLDRCKRRAIARFKEVVAKTSFDSCNPKEISLCFAELYKKQKSQANALGHVARKQFKEHDFSHVGSFAFWRFGTLEEAIILAWHERENAFAQFWVQIKEQFPAIGGPLQITNLDEFNQAHSWMNNRDNAPAFQAITSLPLRRVLYALPPEIGMLTELENLSVHSREEVNFKLTGLPVEIGSLKKLKHLDLFEGHDFEEIPSVIGELTSLQTLLISGPIQVIPEKPLAQLPHLHGLWISNSKVDKIPDTLWRRMYGRHTTQIITQTPSGKRHTSITFGIDPKQLHEIPLILYLRQNWTFSYLKLWGPFKEYFEIGKLLSDFPCIPLASLPLCIFTSLSFSLIFVLEVTLNLPFFLLNTLVMYGVEPLATTFRDLFGYSRTIRLD